MSQELALETSVELTCEERQAYIERVSLLIETSTEFANVFSEVFGTLPPQQLLNQHILCLLGVTD